MKRLIALMMVGVMSAACLKAAPESTVSSQAGGIEKVVPSMTSQKAVNVATLASFVTQKEAQFAVLINPGVLSEVRPPAVTKVAVHRVTGISKLKPAWLVNVASVRWKVVHRTPTAKVGFVVAYSQPGPLGPDNPASSITTEKMSFAWCAPADDNPAIEGRKGDRQEGLVRTNEVTTLPHSVNFSK